MPERKFRESGVPGVMGIMVGFLGMGTMTKGWVSTLFTQRRK